MKKIIRAAVLLMGVSQHTYPMASESMPSKGQGLVLMGTGILGIGLAVREYLSEKDDGTNAQNAAHARIAGLSPAHASLLYPRYYREEKSAAPYNRVGRALGLGTAGIFSIGFGFYLVFKASES